MTQYIKTFFIVAAVLCVSSVAAHAYVIDFEGLDNGEIVNSQYSSSYGVTIGAVNYHKPFDLAATFDSSFVGATADPDLQSPWDGGNIAAEQLGNVLIISENSRVDDDGLLVSPDDEGRRPAGYFFFDFAEAVHGFGFDLIDVDGSAEYDNGHFASFYSGSDLVEIGFEDLIDVALFGNNTANRIAPILASDYGFSYFDRVEIHMGGSGAIDNINVVTPEPSTFLLLGLGLLGFVAAGRRRSARN